MTEDKRLEELRDRAEQLFEQLPAEIQDPLWRRDATPVSWSSTSAQPAVADLIALNDDEFDMVRAAAEVTEKYLELKKELDDRSDQRG